MNNMYNPQFRTNLDILGEHLVFDYNGENYTIPASLKQSTRQVYNLAPREFYFEGQCAYTYDGVNRIKAGDYFVRESVPDYRKYYVASIIPETYAPDLGYMFAIQCNAEISLARLETTETEYGFTQEEVKYAENICVYFTTVPRSYQKLNDGNLDQTIYNAIISASYPVSIDDRLYRNMYVKGDYKPVAYRIESIDTALMTYDYENQTSSGIINVQMTEDLRAIDG